MASGTADSNKELDSLYEVSEKLGKMVKEFAHLARPNKLVFLRGTDKEYKSLISDMVSKNTLITLNPKEYENCYLYRSNPNDVARTEQNTFICVQKKDDAGPTNNWMDPDSAKDILFDILDGAMEGKTMYIVPYLLGPKGSPHSECGIELTDSQYVAANMMVITKTGEVALKRLQDSGRFVLGVHATADCDAKKRYISHFPYEKVPLVISVNTEYGGNALMSKKCHALRLASCIARKENWMAEHMGCIGIKDPSEETTYITFAFPSASGKTNLSMLKPPKAFEEWSTTLVSDDIVWFHMEKGRLHAINPESGLFGVVVGTNEKSNPEAMKMIRKNTLFTNVGLTDTNLPWWEGKSERPAKLVDWQGKPYDGKSPAAQANSRFTVPIDQYEYLSKLYYEPQGAPVSAILFGGRRESVVPLVVESFSWEHGVLIGAMQRVETTAALVGAVGVVRNDPMAMRPFCGYNMGDYFAHWLEMGKRLEHRPRIYNVNWFMKNEKKEFMWPGFGENIRVIKWIIERKKGGKENAVETPLGYMPDPKSFDAGGVKPQVVEKLLNVDKKAWLKELEEVKPFFESFGTRFPERLWKEYYALKDRLEKW